MDNDDIERRAARRRHVEKALQFRPAVIGAACARLDEFSSNIPAARGAELLRLPPLVGNGKVGFGLTAGRYAEVQRGPLPHGFFRHL